MPTSSKPIFSIFAAIPTAESTISASKVTFPLAVFTLAFTPSPEVSRDSTEAFVITSIPAFFRDFSKCLETSSSSTGTIFGINSTTVTLVPIVA